MFQPKKTSDEVDFIESSVQSLKEIDSEVGRSLVTINREQLTLWNVTSECLQMLEQMFSTWGDGGHTSHASTLQLTAQPGAAAGGKLPPIIRAGNVCGKSREILPLLAGSLADWPPCKCHNISTAFIVAFAFRPILVFLCGLFCWFNVTFEEVPGCRAAAGGRPGALMVVVGSPAGKKSMTVNENWTESVWRHP